MLYSKTTPTIRDFRDNLYHKIDCLPVGQRLPVYSKDNAKGIGIITTLLDGYDIGTITLMKLNEFVKFQYESIDGGHRKRALWSYLQNEFEVNGKCFSQLSKKEQDKFLDTELSFTVYNALDSATKGHIFRTLNKTTDVNFIEMLNSYGDIQIANYIRETVRVVKQIDNEFHSLFDFSISPKGKPTYRYLNFDNDRLKQDHAFARLVYRWVRHPKELLGGSSDSAIETMYEDPDLTTKDIPMPKIKEQLEFLRIMGQNKNTYGKKGLSQHDFKALSYLYFYLVDTYGSFKISDSEEFYKVYYHANSVLMNPDGKFSKVVHETSGYSVQIMYKKYIAAPWDGKKISTAISYLIGQMGDIEKIIETRDNKRSFSVLEKEAKLAEQNCVCAVDGKKLEYKDAHAAHIIAHANGGRTIYSNLAMVRACYNKEMGTMNLNEYKNRVYDR
tara:strand:+ start:813 stop:2144 length:1332 start_codon:yes stop_codon:yes gene_type:complete